LLLEGKSKKAKGKNKELKYSKLFTFAFLLLPCFSLLSDKLLHSVGSEQ